MDQLYSYTFEKENEAGFIRGKLSFNQSHPIYKGHFPDQPVTPGVCQVEAIKHIISDYFKMELHLIQAKDIKFVSMIIPAEHSTIDYSIEYEAKGAEYIIKGSLFASSQVFLKMRATFGKPAK